MLVWKAMEWKTTKNEIGSLNLGILVQNTLSAFVVVVVVVLERNPIRDE